MQFSTSAALAAMAIFVGQSLADNCWAVQPGDHSAEWEISNCIPVGGGNQWNCGNDLKAYVARGGNTFAVEAASYEIVIAICCSGTCSPSSYLGCPANGNGQLTLNCPGGYSVDYWQRK
ncbi:hypothetical protein E4U21_000214 [Claviceps maximensis]|nr:hypothetical protein E4U21_000214 [Claviceps maximensis]